MISTRNVLRNLTLVLPAIGTVLALGAGTGAASADAAAITVSGTASTGHATVARSAAATGPAVTAQAAAYACSPGYFCIYDGFGGTGHRCQWAQPSVRATTDCSWIASGHNVRSVRNRTNHRVQYYTQTNFNHRIGSTPSGGHGDLQGNYQIRSFKPQK